MHDGYFQNTSEAYLEQFLNTASGNPQALLLSAYMDEKKKWEDNLNIIRTYENTIIEKIRKLCIMADKKDNELDKLKLEIEKKSGVWHIILCALGIKTKIERKFDRILNENKSISIEIKKLTQEHKDIVEAYKKIWSNPPNAKQYELAIIGNTLFKPR